MTTLENANDGIPDDAPEREMGKKKIEEGTKERGNKEEKEKEWEIEEETEEERKERRRNSTGIRR